MSAPSTAPAISTCEVTRWLDGAYPGGDAALAARARDVMLREVGPMVHLRGLLEFSNYCECDCHYCGIRRSAAPIRFALDEEEIVVAARRSLAAGFGSMTLQSGERTDRRFVDFVVRILRRIKRETRTSQLPDGLGITLCVGEQTRESYERFYEAGAHRYLLRIETSDEALFAAIHPDGQRFDRRVRALCDLKEIGYQLGTGVMIGIPGQSATQLARDVAFFAAIDADMIGMGPYLEAPGPAAERMRERGMEPDRSLHERLRLALRMIAVTRIALRDVNIAAATALQAISPTGREAGLAYGANVLMPLVTPSAHRSAYRLYEGKPCVDEAADACERCTPARAARIGRPVTMNAWGDAPHATARRTA